MSDQDDQTAGSVHEDHGADATEAWVNGARAALPLVAPPFVILFAVAVFGFFLQSPFVLAMVVFGVIGMTLGTAWTINIVGKYLQGDPGEDPHTEERRPADIDLERERRAAWPPR